MRNNRYPEVTLFRASLPASAVSVSIFRSSSSSPARRRARRAKNVTLIESDRLFAYA